MIELTVLAGQTEGIDFAPASEYAEILQNVRTILATPVYSVPSPQRRMYTKFTALSAAGSFQTCSWGP